MAQSFKSLKLENKICSKPVFIQLLQTNHNTSIAQKGVQECVTISFVNPFSYKLIAENTRIIDAIDYWFIDGSLLCILTNLTREEKIERASFDFSSVATDFFNYVALHRTPVALVGAATDEIEDAATNLKLMFPKLKVVYNHHGYIKKEQFQTICEQLDAQCVERLVVGMGTPMQEEFTLFVKQHSKTVKQIVTCGGFLTQTAIKGDYYHPLVKKFGLRWLQRAVMHSHVRRRLIKDYPKFIFNYCYSHLRGK